VGAGALTISPCSRAVPKLPVDHGLTTTSIVTVSNSEAGEHSVRPLPMPCRFRRQDVGDQARWSRFIRRGTSTTVRCRTRQPGGSFLPSPCWRHSSCGMSVPMRRHIRLRTSAVCSRARNRSYRRIRPASVRSLRYSPVVRSWCRLPRRRWHRPHPRRRPASGRHRAL
jgi:hypothetical protein